MTAPNPNAKKKGTWPKKEAWEYVKKDRAEAKASIGEIYCIHCPHCHKWLSRHQSIHHNCRGEMNHG